MFSSVLRTPPGRLAGVLPPVPIAILADGALLVEKVAVALGYKETAREDIDNRSIVPTAKHL